LVLRRVQCAFGHQLQGELIVVDGRDEKRRSERREAHLLLNFNIEDWFLRIIDGKEEELVEVVAVENGTHDLADFIQC